MRRAAILLFAALLPVACSSGGDFFYVQSAGAVMPVLARGDLASGAFLVVIHGGPGDSAQWYAASPEFKQLEASMAVVYWDQRAAGSSLGNPARESNRLSQYVEDLGVVIDVLKDRFPVESIILLGHSWGGRLGSEYLASERKDPLVKGWIDVDGLDGYTSTYLHSRAWVLETAPKRLAKPDLTKEERAAAEGALAWHEAQPELGAGTFEEVYGRFEAHAAHVRAMGGYINAEAPENAPKGISTELFFSSPMDPFATVSHTTQARQYWDNRPEETERLLADVDLSKVTTPSLLLWGRHDGAIPVAVGESKLARLAASEKQLLIFEGSGHSPMFEEGPRFVSEVQAFIERHR